MSIVLELVRPQDAMALTALKVETFLQTFAADNDPASVQAHLDRELTTEAVERSLTEEGSTTWWLLDDGTPVGYLKVNRGASQTEPDLTDGLEVQQVYVLASHHGRGLGGRLLDHAFDVARAEGLGYVWLGVWERNHRALAVYEHLGFGPFGEHTFHFGPEEQRDVLLRRDV